MNCPRCGSPVNVDGSRWECGWCLDSGWLSSLPRQAVTVRFVCFVDLPESWAHLSEVLSELTPKHAEELKPSLFKAAIHQLSLSPLPEHGSTDPRFLQDLRTFLDAETAFRVSPDTAESIEYGKELYTKEASLSGERLGSFWQSLLKALADENADPWETDTDNFFRTLALFRSWRRGGPGNDPDYLASYHALQDVFHEHWERINK